MASVASPYGLKPVNELGGNANAGGPFYGKLEDGSPVMTDYFDVGHTLLVVREDGSKVAAPDADHIVYLRGLFDFGCMWWKCRTNFYRLSKCRLNSSC